MYYAVHSDKEVGKVVACAKILLDAGARTSERKYYQSFYESTLLGELVEELAVQKQNERVPRGEDKMEAYKAQLKKTELLTQLFVTQGALCYTSDIGLIDTRMTEEAALNESIGKKTRRQKMVDYMYSDEEKLEALKNWKSGYAHKFMNYLTILKDAKRAAIVGNEISSLIGQENDEKSVRNEDVQRAEHRQEKPAATKLPKKKYLVNNSAFPAGNDRMMFCKFKANPLEP